MSKTAIPTFRQVMEVLRELGVKDVDVATTLFPAMDVLRNAVDGKTPAPGLLIVDLVVGMDSGYEVLRFWRSNAKLKAIPVVVWTAVGSTVDESICKHFKVTCYVQKQHGASALKEALQPLIKSIQ